MCRRRRTQNEYPHMGRLLLARTRGCVGLSRSSRSIWTPRTAGSIWSIGFFGMATSKALLAIAAMLETEPMRCLLWLCETPASILAARHMLAPMMLDTGRRDVFGTRHIRRVTFPRGIANEATPRGNLARQSCDVWHRFKIATSWQPASESQGRRKYDGRPGLPCRPVRLCALPVPGFPALRCSAPRLSYPAPQTPVR